MGDDGRGFRAVCDALGSVRSPRQSSSVRGSLSAHARPHRCAGLLLVLGLVACFVAPGSVLAAEIERDRYYWYVPEHEKYGRSEFFAGPSFESLQIPIVRKQRFRLADVRHGWAALEFDGGTRAYLHIRILRVMLYDPAASDPWHELERASVFAQDPDKLEAQLRAGTTPPAAASSKLPVWKRYRENWGGHSETATEGDPPKNSGGRSKHTLLPPIVPSSGARAAPGSSGPTPPAQP